MDSQPPDQSTARSTRTPKLRLDELLVDRGLAETRAQAQRLIQAGKVYLADEVADKPGRQVPQDAPVHLQEALRYVSRGGLKLEAALDAFEIDPAGWVCADIGASTGGFTDCLLQRGAARVYAVDVGYGQLAWSLRIDSRVVSIERTNIRYLGPLPEPASLATVDVSFIGLALVLPRVAGLLAPTGQIIALIKPQFEVGKGQVGKGGVVRDPKLHRSVIERALVSATEVDLAAAGVIRSPITGPAGNVEFLAWLRLGGDLPSSEMIGAWLDACVG
jgi:23S rRNA (cytidine1920-2'-O)/16S rRNA (cytidine1409-2'-O)-methyltransferase